MHGPTEGIVFDPDRNQEWIFSTIQAAEAKTVDDGLGDKVHASCDTSSISLDTNKDAQDAKSQFEESDDECVEETQTEEDLSSPSMLAPDLSDDDFGVSTLTKATFAARGPSFIQQRNAIFASSRGLKQMRTEAVETPAKLQPMVVPEKKTKAECTMLHIMRRLRLTLPDNLLKFIHHDEDKYAKWEELYTGVFTVPDGYP